MTTGERIRNARKRAGMTQKELADRLGVQFQNVSSLERDERSPKFETLKKIAAALDVSVGELLGTDPQSDSRHRAIWQDSLERKLQAIGCSIGADLDNGELWINRPKGPIKVTLDELEALSTLTDNYLRFLLDQMDEGIRFK